MPPASAPTLIVGGGSTSKIPQETLTAAAKLVPDATVTFEGAGHHVQSTRPTDLATAIDNHFPAS